MGTQIQGIPLEDELGDVLEKALCLAGLTPELAAEKAGIDLARLLDALDWRSELGTEELRSLAEVLKLNEVGLCALATGAYPATPIEGLPFCLHPLRMAHGIGVANAYLITECCSDHGILFDTGANLEHLLEAWPSNIRHLDAVFITHVEQEHAGALCELVSHFGVKQAFYPKGAKCPCGEAMIDGQKWKAPYVSVTAMGTPGHSAAHNSYLLECSCACRGRKLLISGDIIFAGSIACAFQCPTKLFESLDRILKGLPDDTLIAPGHGPLTSVKTEKRFNPFAR